MYEHHHLLPQNLFLKFDADANVDVKCEQGLTDVIDFDTHATQNNRRTVATATSRR